jgi:thiazole synthase ThiGH ThiG subunit
MNDERFQRFTEVSRHFDLFPLVSSEILIRSGWTTVPVLWLINTAMARAQSPVPLGRAMGLATQAGRLATHAGRIPIQTTASPSSPMAGRINA